MKVFFTQGSFYMDGKEVKKVEFKDGTERIFGEENLNDIAIVTKDAMPSVSVISGKNIVTPGSVIIAGGDFHIGDK